MSRTGDYFVALLAPDNRSALLVSELTGFVAKKR
jgi:hypothetical protein